MRLLRWLSRCLAWLAVIAAAWFIVLVAFAAGMWAAWELWAGE